MTRALFRPFTPEGLRYERDAIMPERERELAEIFATLPLKQFEFHGHLGKRRVVSYGFRYDFGVRKLQEAEELPPFLRELREVAASFAGLPPEALVQSSVIEYAAGTEIGWHRDKPEFGDVIGISFLSACRFRFRRKSGSAWERFTLPLEPRSIYMLRGPARDAWEHSIPAVPSLRYSATFRSLR
jgi:alkylated DNA repair dioxygenase AlkB